MGPPSTDLYWHIGETMMRFLARTERSAAPIEDVGRALAAALRPPVSAAR